MWTGQLYERRCLNFHHGQKNCSVDVYPYEMPSLHHSGEPVLKRKKQEKVLSSRKKAKTQLLSLHELPWKTLQRPQVAGLGHDDGILELEEVEGVEVVYEEGGRVARFNVSRTMSEQQDSMY
jgi:ATP-dependent RNA helicase DDX24/MAK5